MASSVLAPAKQLLTKEQVAEFLQIHPASVWRLCRDNPDFPRPIAVGGRLKRWNQQALNDWVARQEAKAAD